MSVTLEVESTLTDRFQTTVPETVRRTLRLKKRDKIQYSIRENGEVVLSRAQTSESADPVLTEFLGFLARDMARHPKRLRAIDAKFVRRLRSLTRGVDVNLDTSLPEDGE